MGRLRIKSLSMTRVSGGNNASVEVWAVTDAGELVCRRDVTPANPAVSSVSSAFFEFILPLFRFKIYI